ncbi:MAG: ferrochelatase [Kofleriaceae bacterium]|nr:ferrochelatase [Myxococcales bacterium]MCB9565006.1 ferrochelatase [Kofleriaceae bacterium]MCB9575081.1 ferrochelatase [Kofleriaceae bacterium]
MPSDAPTGLLLLNLGTPDAPTASAVRRYLAQFLSDPRVLDMNPVGRWLLLHGIILRTRPAKSAHAYQQIWDAQRGSPLLSHSQELAAEVATRLGDRWRVALGMRYGNPSIAAALAELRGGPRPCDRIVALPLFPQYASSSTGSAVEELWRVASAGAVVPSLEIGGAFYDDPGFIAAFAAVGRPILDDFGADHVMFSFHGLPERHVQATDPTGAHCLRSDACCAAIVDANRHCYRAQCHVTARALIAALALDPARTSVAFQSRLGRVPWIKPYTDKVLDELAAAGVKRLAVFCPAFVADCLETLEEIGLRARAQFVAAGGEDLILVPSLNASPAWADAVAAMARRHDDGRALPAGSDAPAVPASRAVE